MWQEEWELLEKYAKPLIWFGNHLWQAFWHEIWQAFVQSWELQAFALEMFPTKPGNTGANVGLIKKTHLTQFSYSKYKCWPWNMDICLHQVFRPSCRTEEIISVCQNYFMLLFAESMRAERRDSSQQLEELDGPWTQLIRERNLHGFGETHAFMSCG